MKGGYVVGISNGRDTLQRVAFETSTGQFYKFAINPQSMTEQVTARNTFLQTDNTIHMQGFGQGLHTIEISGTTGVNHGKGFDNLLALKKLIVDHINSAHDNTNASSTGNVELIFHNFTNNASYKVELNQEGIKIEQSVDDPLSYRYSISMVVVGDASNPATSEITWIQLGNINPSIPVKKVPAGMEYQYGKTGLKDFDFAGYQKAFEEFQKSSVETIKNYGQSGMYKKDFNLSREQVINIYKVVYGKVLPDFDWNKYVSAVGLFNRKKGGSINNYGQDNWSDTTKILPPYDLQTIYQKLYRNTVPAFDSEMYARLSSMFQQMKLGTILDYGESGEANTEDSTLKLADALELFSIIYGKTVPEINYQDYAEAATKFSNSKNESILNYDQDNALDAMFNSWNNEIGQKLVSLGDNLNPWEVYTNSYQNRYTGGIKKYVNPLVSKDAFAYTCATIDNVLRI